MLTKYLFVNTTLSTLLILLVCTACSKSLPKYTYTAQPDSAYISGAAITRDLAVADATKSGIVPHVIDGQEIPNPYGIAADLGLVERNYRGPESAQLPIPLKPGLRKIEASIFGGRRTAKSEFVLDAKPNTHYFIKQKVIFDTAMIVEEPSIVTYWVEDSQGTPVTEMQTVTREQMDIPPIFVAVPVYR